MSIKAVNNFVFIKINEEGESLDSLWMPDGAKEPPMEGTIISVGKLVKDQDIKNHKNKTCIFHKGTGFMVPYDGIDYLVLEDVRIIALV